MKVKLIEIFLCLLIAGKTLKRNTMPNLYPERIYFFPKENNWWGPVGEAGPCGPDTEMFYDVTGKPHGSGCRPEDGCGRFLKSGMMFLWSTTKLLKGSLIY